MVLGRLRKERSASHGREISRRRVRRLSGAAEPGLGWNEETHLAAAPARVPSE